MLAFNESGEIGFVNRPLADLLGVAARELLGQPLSAVLSGADQQRLSVCAEQVAGGRDGDACGDGQDSLAVTLLAADGRRLPNEVEIVPLTLDEECLFLVTVKNPADPVETRQREHRSTLNFVDALNRNRERIRALEEVLNGSLAKIEAANPGVAGELQAVDGALAALGRALARQTDPEGRRKAALAVMQAALACWEDATGKSKFDLARDSGLWKVYTNRDGWERAQTLDKYLDPAAFPQKPRLNQVLQTADFVLAACTTSSPARQDLQIARERLRAIR